MSVTDVKAKAPKKASTKKITKAQEVTLKAALEAAAVEHVPLSELVKSPLNVRIIPYSVQQLERWIVPNKLCAGGGAYVRNNPWKTERTICARLTGVSCEWDVLSSWLETESERHAREIQEHIITLEEHIQAWAVWRADREEISFEGAGDGG